MGDYLGWWLDEVVYFKHRLVATAPPGEEDMPVGAIALWSLKNGPIPTGWVECDGVQNAPGPDLRDKFVVGRSPSRTVDSTGGSSTHGHTDNLTHTGTAVADHAALPHSGTAVADHPALSHSGTAVADHTNVSVPATATAAVKIGTSSASAAAQTHTHTIASITHSVTQPNDHPAQSHSVTQPSNHPAQSHSVTQPSDHAAHAPVNHEPPYYVLIYIQRMT